MKKLTILTFVFLMTFSLCGIAQNNDYAANLAKLQKLNGSMATYDVVFKQLKMLKPNVSDSAWTAVKKEIFDVHIEKLNQQLLPVYQKHFTLDDIKALIAFYETPIGKKLAHETPMITGENLQISQQWGMTLMQEIISFLDKKG